jgi:hypothetical protein
MDRSKERWWSSSRDNDEKVFWAKQGEMVQCGDIGQRYSLPRNIAQRVFFAMIDTFSSSRDR